MDIYNKELHRKQKIISQKNYTILAMTIGFVIFAILLVIIYLKKRQLKTKNQIIYNQITAINIPFDRQSKIDDENLSDEQKASKHIFIQLIDLVKNEKVYLDPQITRERIAQRIGTNENYISKALHDHSETNLSELLNRERVNEAIKHIKGNPYINNQELIQLCGFNSERSFYRIFKKTTGFTPTEFKNITKNQQQKANPGIELL